jgi:protein SCO1/2
MTLGANTGPVSLAAAIFLGAMLASPVVANAASPHEDHSGHQASTTRLRSEHVYALPALNVTRADARRMTLAQAIDDGRPVMLNFVYTSCNSICPVTSQVFVEVRERMGADRDKVNMVSISIDPEQDTPGKLTEYAKRFGSAGVWAHYTSNSADAVSIQRAFDVWRGDKMNHQPTTFIRSSPGKPWVRLDGFYAPSALVSEFQKTLSAALTQDNCDGAAQGVSAPSSTAGAQAGINTKCKS